MPECVHLLEPGTCALCKPGGRTRLAGGSRTGKTASLHFDHSTVEIDCDYDPDFVAELKGALPSYARRWDGDRKVWVVASEWWDAAEAVVSSYFELLD